MPKKKRKAAKKKPKSGWCVKSGKTTVSRHRLKKNANKKAAVRRRAGKKASVVKCKMKRK